MASIHATGRLFAASGLQSSPSSGRLINRRLPASHLASALVLCCAILAGCSAPGGGAGAPGAALPDPDETAKPVTPPANALVIDETEPNDDFAGAVALAAEAGGAFYLAGALKSTDDIDVFDLGAIEAGDQVTVRIQSAADVWLSAALFDETAALIAIGFSHVADDGNTLEFSALSRAESDSWSLVVAAYGARYNAIGAYEAGVVIEPHRPVPNPQAQRVLLNFAGPELVACQAFPEMKIVPFDAGVISTELAAHTDEIAERVVELVRQHFVGFDVTFVASWEAWEPGDDLSVVHIGAEGDTLLGLAENIDQDNVDRSDEAVIFVPGFRPFAELEPTVEQIATALANVIAHETGHLLGLEHTRNSGSVMDVSGTVGHLVRLRSFGLYPLEPAVFPVGQQDSWSVLLDALGGDEEVVAERRAEQFEASSGRPLPGYGEVVQIDWAPRSLDHYPGDVGSAD